MTHIKKLNDRASETESKNCKNSSADSTANGENQKTSTENRHRPILADSPPLSCPALGT